MSQVPGLLAAAAGAALLFTSGFSKLARPMHLRRTLQALGAAAGPARWGAIVLPIAEVVAAASLASVRGTAWPLVSLAGLGGAFMVAGLVAASKDETVECACFGGAGGTQLGWRQVAAFPLWVVAGLVISSSEAAESGREAWLLTVSGLLLSAVWLSSVLAVYVLRIRSRRIERARHAAASAGHNVRLAGTG